MKVVLLKDVKGSGKAGEIKEVSDGYAVNYLLPNKLARAAQSSDLNRKDKKSFAEKKISKKREELKKIYKQLQNFQLHLKAKADEQNHLFGSINPKTLQKELQEKGIEVPAGVLNFEPIKQLGYHEVVVDFGDIGKAKIKITITKE